MLPVCLYSQDMISAWLEGFQSNYQNDVQLGSYLTVTVVPEK